LNTLIVGSVALKDYIVLGREPKDFDIWSDDPMFDDVNALAGLRLEKFWHANLIEFFANRTSTGTYATLDELYTIKCSHAGWELRNGSWDKHMSDIVSLKKAGAKIQDEQFKILYKVWQDVHGSKQLKLQKGKDDFFGDAVTRKYDHDSLHESVAYGDYAMYIDILKDGSDVDVDMGKIKALPWDQQIRLFREEVYATALERKVIPSDYTISPRKAYAWALRRTITSLTKGWSSRFLIENYDVMRTPDVDYVKVHLSKADKLIPLEAK
jgi:hypothetical protein